MGTNQELTTYRQMEVETSSPVELVIMLYDALVKDLKLVIAAIRVQDIEERVKQSNHGFHVLQELEVMLDFENGGSTAKELAGVYSYVRAKLMESQLKLNPAILERQIEFILQLRQAWQESVTTTTVSKPLAEIPAFPQAGGSLYGSMGEGAQSCSWSA
jgi:flagellar protein FliS